MATVEVSFTALPAHVRTARLIALAVARRAGVADDLLDEVRLAVGEACSRAVSVNQADATPVVMRMTDAQSRFTVEVVDSGAFDDVQDEADLTSLGEGAQEGDESAAVETLPSGFGLAVVSGLVEDMAVVGDDRGTTVRMTWPALDEMAPSPADR